MSKIKYASRSTRANVQRNVEYEISNTDIFIELISLSYVLFMRNEFPNSAKSIPVITHVSQLLEQIVEEKRYALATIIQPKNALFYELTERIKVIFDQKMDKFKFERNEKELGWLLLKAHTSEECKEILHISDSQFRYTIRKMCSKTGTKKKGDMISKMRDEIMEG